MLFKLLILSGSSQYKGNFVTTTLYFLLNILMDWIKYSYYTTQSYTYVV